MAKRAHQHMSQFQDLIRADIPLARQALRNLLPEPIRFTPMGERGFELSGKIDGGTLFAVCLGDKTPRRQENPSPINAC